MGKFGIVIIVAVVLIGVGAAYYFLWYKPGLIPTHDAGTDCDPAKPGFQKNGIANTACGTAPGTGENNPPPPATPAEPERFCTPKNYSGQNGIMGNRGCLRIVGKDNKTFMFESFGNTTNAFCCYKELTAADAGSGGDGGNGDGSSDGGNGSLLCRTACDFAHPFNKEKRDACKENCK